MRDKCSKHLIKLVNADNCVKTLVVADRHADHHLKKVALHCLLDNKTKLTEQIEKELEGNAVTMTPSHLCGPA